MDFIRGLFSAEPGLDRVHPAGIALMVAGAAAALFVSGALEKRAKNGQRAAIICRVGGLVLACIGALIAIA